NDTQNHTSWIASSTSSNFAVIGSSDEQKLKWLVTARARLGWASDCSFWYVTGGVAQGQITNHYTFGAQGAAPGGGVLLQAPGVVADFSSTKSGYAVGFGVETSLALFGVRLSNWTTKMEYLYVDLGTVINTFTAPNTTATAFYAYT